MSFSHLLKLDVNVELFRTKFNIPRDVNISYCHVDDIEGQRLPHCLFSFDVYIRGRS